MSGQPAEAYAKYQEAAAQAPPHGIYKLYSNMSLAALTMGDPAAALDAALLAVQTAPADWTTVRPRGLMLPATRCQSIDSLRADLAVWQRQAVPAFSLVLAL